jgi:hypothetical protein
MGRTPGRAGQDQDHVAATARPGDPVEVQGETGAKRLPPTLGEDGEPRRWNDCDTIAPLPEAALLFLENALTPKQEPRRSDPVWTLSATNGASPEARARSYVFAPGFPDSIAGQRGHDRLYHVVCVLVDDFGLTRNQAMPISRDWNAAKAQLPESESQLEHKLDDAIRNHPTPTRRLLNAEHRVHHKRNGNAKHTAATATEVDDDSDPIKTRP